MPNQFTSHRPAIRVIGPSIAYIDLLNGNYALIEVEDAALIEKWCWKAIFPKGNRNWYACRNHRISRTKQVCMLMHAFLLPGDRKRDHINGNGWDNRRANLRFASTAQNGWNSQLHIKNTSGFKGVSWDSEKKKWAAEITINGKKSHLGRFKIIEDAARAYQIAAASMQGEFARLPPPPPHP